MLPEKPNQAGILFYNILFLFFRVQNLERLNLDGVNFIDLKNMVKFLNYKNSLPKRIFSYILFLLYKILEKYYNNRKKKGD